MLLGSSPIRTRTFAILRLSAAVSRMRFSIVERSALMGSIGSSLTRRSVPPECIPDIDDRGAILKALFVAAHEFESGPSLHLAATQQPRHQRGHSGNRGMGRTCGDWSRLTRTSMTKNPR